MRTDHVTFRTEWRLRTSAASPFGRKVRLAVAAIGMTDQLEVIAADTSDPHDDVRQQNPLGKVPVLLLNDGRAIFDSHVIVDFLNDYDGRSLLIPRGGGRYVVQVQQ